MKVTMIVSKNGKNYGYVFSTKRKNKPSVMSDILEVCKKENVNVENLEIN